MAGRDPLAGRRTALTRFWAGLVGVVGLAQVLTRSALTSDYDYRRVLEPWIGDAALILFSGILIERAFRRDASAFVYAAALGLVIALTDLNFSYLSSSTQVGRAIEGVILLAAGYGVAHLRGRIGPPGDPTRNSRLALPAAGAPTG